MVTLAEVRRHNSGLGSRSKGLVAVFTGATRGIGLATLRQLVIQLPSPAIYVVGRSESKFANELHQLRSLNHNARIHFVEAEIALLREVDRVCQVVLTAQSRLDLLFMSQGFIPMGAPVYTSDGVDSCMSLSHYGRVSLVRKLLPLLHKSDSPRVVTVLAGGTERRPGLVVNDMSLKGCHGTTARINHITCLQTLAMAQLADSNPRVCFIHSHPGLVATEIVSNAFAKPSEGWLDYAIRFCGSFILAPIIRTFLAISEEESGERHAFLATSNDYLSPELSRTHGQHSHQAELDSTKGLYLVNAHGELKADWQLLRDWMSDGTVDKVWDHTMHVIEGSRTQEECT